ncbi:MAG TPA: tautomerase family protein [Stellaceae bacterium]|nr:tautomerase family protein [Stellaceae bacterium]
MPDLLVELRGAWLGERKADFIEAINAGLVAALHTPPEETLLRLIEHGPGDFLVPQGSGERFTRMEITLFAGRSIAAKRRLYQTLVHCLATFGVAPEDVKIVLIEVPKENVGYRGGKPASEIDLGYEVAV